MASNGEPDESLGSQLADGPLQASRGSESTPREALRSWALSSHTPLIPLTSLLRIMRPLFPDLPLDAPTLLGGPVVTRMGSDFYV
nr:unnamed protein product [Spirometra erinaceieuropaei]